jgi:hypothetical protein
VSSRIATRVAAIQAEVRSAEGLLGELRRQPIADENTRALLDEAATGLDLAVGCLWSAYRAESEKS